VICNIRSFFSRVGYKHLSLPLALRRNVKLIFFISLFHIFEWFIMEARILELRNFITVLSIGNGLDFSAFPLVFRSIGCSFPTFVRALDSIFRGDAPTPLSKPKPISSLVPLPEALVLKRIASRLGSS